VVDSVKAARDVFTPIAGDWVGPVANSPSHNSSLASVADPRSRPPHGTSQAWKSSSRLWNGILQRTMRPLRANETGGPQSGKTRCHNAESPDLLPPATSYGLASGNMIGTSIVVIGRECTRRCRNFRSVVYG
jgi:hypothetical protein